MPGADICTPEVYFALLIEAEGGHISVPIQNMSILLIPTLKPVVHRKKVGPSVACVTSAGGRVLASIVWTATP